MSTVSGTLTVMFTDLVGSTALGDRLGDEAAQALRRAHDRILRQEFERFSGTVVKGTGDGFMVAFQSARQGVECAAAVQQAIAAQHAEGRYSELSVRIGLHTGEPVAEGDDLFGSDVNLAARIEAEAEGGQVLVSEVTRLLARGTPGTEFTSLGERALKGFAEPVPLFEARRHDSVSVRPRLARFVGRQEEAAKLRQRLEMAGRGQGSLVLVAGEPGVGKTRLVSELAIYATDRGFQVLSGHAYDTEGMPPYLPFTQALGPYVRSRSPEELLAELNGNAAYLAKLLPELRQMLPATPEPPALSAESERYQVFQSVSELLLTAAAKTPLMLVLDDLHWADDSSLLLLQHLAGRLAEGPLLTVGTFRDVEVDAKHPMARLLAEMARQRTDGQITLRPFGREETAALMEDVVGHVPVPHIVDALFAAAEGNPFFIEELVRHLEEQGRNLADPQADVGGWAIPDGVRQVITRRLDRLGEEANRVLAYSSVLGRDLTLLKVAAATGQDEDSLLDLLDEALSAHVVREQGDGYVFAHPLIQETLYQGLSAPRRRQLHRRVAEALEALYAADPEPHVAELANHFCQAAPGGDVEKAVDYAARAGRRALSQVAYQEASRHYAMALGALDLKEKPDEAERCELLLTLAEAQRRAGETRQAMESCEQAAQAARKLGSPNLLARAALDFGRTGAVAGRDEEGQVGLLEEALDALEDTDSALRARVMARLAIALTAPAGFQTEALGRGLSLSQQAVDMARRVGDPTALAYTWNARRFVYLDPESLDERLESATELFQLAEDAGDKEMALEWRHWRLIDLLELGDIEAVDVEIEAYSSLAQELRQPHFLRVTAILQAMRALLVGRFEDTERLAQEALAIGQRMGAQNAAANFAIVLFFLRREQGRLGELEAVQKSFAQQFPAMALVRAATALMYCETGREAEARAEFEHLATNRFADLPRDFLWTACLAGLSEVSAYLGDTHRAAILYGLALPYAKRNFQVGYGSVCCGSAGRYLGLLATVMRRWKDAARHFHDALEMHTRMGARPWLAHTQHDYARMLLARGEPADRDKALALLDQAQQTASELGMKALADRIQALTSSGAID
ncbi:MAG: AAA family ATPase [Chloroflexi bacterium]|nr:AAA family ATPase [Chloroflexota bacterium]